MPKRNKHKQNFHFDIEATGKGGDTVPVVVDIEVPENRGMFAIYILNQGLDDMKKQILNELISSGDLSVLEAMGNGEADNV